MKKRLACIIVLIALALSSTAGIMPAFASRLLGDINGDGSINSVDYLMLKRYCLGTYSASAIQKKAGDINSDGNVNAIDYLMLKRSVLGTYTIAQPTYRTAVSLGKKYTVSVAAATQYADSYGCELTDGVFASTTSPFYGDSAFSGFNSDVNVIIDLADDGIALNGFEVSFFSTTSAGINQPSSIAISGSSDNSAWTAIGSMTIPALVNGTVQKAVYNPESELAYRYIRFEIKRKSSWLFLDEVTVYANVPDYGGIADEDTLSAYESDTLTDSVRAQNVAALSSGSAYSSETGMTLISKGDTYTVTCSGYDWRSAASDTLLTDGALTGTYFESEGWVGVSATEGIAITLDLGQTENDICAFRLHCFSRTATEICLPVYVDIYAGDNTDSLVLVGRSYAIGGDQENYSFSVTLNTLISARYIRFSMPAADTNCWFEEAKVYANRADETTEEFLYGNLDIPEITVPVYGDPTASDYDTEQNLILGLPQQISSDVDLDSTSYSETNTPASSTLLTDGLTTDNTYCYNGSWFHFNSGKGRSIFYDLGALCSISGFSVRILDYNNWSIELPQKLSLVLSEDGVNWYLASEIYPTHDDAVKLVTASGTLESPLRARYAMIHIPVSVHVFIDEITVTGKKNCEVVPALASSSLDSYTVYRSGDELGYQAPDADVLGGVNDVMLIYHTGTTVNKSFLLPYVAYLDSDGNIVDTMFDGYLFLPTTGNLPSGGKPYGTNVKTDWDYLYNDIFGSGVCLSALESTASDVASALSISDFKLKVFITIPHLDTSLTDFGDVDGDGVSEDLTVLANRVKVVRWYASRVRTAFDAAGFQHLELCGFYWFHEAIAGDDVLTAQSASAALDTMGEQLFWIPYYQASGFADWKSFGFSTGCLQPNYAFSLTVQQSRLRYASRLARKYGMSIEIEIQSNAMSDIRYFTKYMDYLRGGIEYGYMNDSIHMYYQGVSDFRTSCYSSDRRLRLIYEYTYQFIKGTLDIVPEALPDMTVFCDTNTAYSGTVTDESGKCRIFSVASSPSHGTVSVSESGEYTYYPNKGFTGTDSFTYVISEYLGWSEECTITVEVG